MVDYIKELRKQIGTKPIILVGATIIVINEKTEILIISNIKNSTVSTTKEIVLYNSTLFGNFSMKFLYNLNEIEISCWR